MGWGFRVRGSGFADDLVGNTVRRAGNVPSFHERQRG